MFHYLGPVTCSHQVDIVFVIDATSSTNFETFIQYIASVVSEITVHQITASRVAIVQYTSSPKLSIKLTDTNDRQTLISTIVSLQRQIPVSTIRNTGAAIDLAYAEIQSRGRVGVGRIIYLLTAGPSSNLETTLEAVSRANDVTLVAMGTEGIREELLSIASSPKLALSLSQLDISSLLSVKESTVDMLCTQGGSIVNW